MIKPAARTFRCAVYTRVSSEHGLEQDFNSLDAQREAAATYVKSQAYEGWRLIKESFDDAGFCRGLPRARARPPVVKVTGGLCHANRGRRR